MLYIVYLFVIPTKLRNILLDNYNFYINKQKSCLVSFSDNIAGIYNHVSCNLYLQFSFSSLQVWQVEVTIIIDMYFVYTYR